MNDLYAYFEISKQGHYDAIDRGRAIEDKLPCYLGFIQEIRDMHPGMGLRTMYTQFQPEGIGRDAFIELGLDLGFRLRRHRNPHRTTYSVKSNRFFNLLGDKRFTGVNQLWVSDIFYFFIASQHYYVVLLMDVYSRRIIGYSVADNMRAENNILALNRALAFRGIKDYAQTLIHHSDRGSQYVSNDYTDLLDRYGIQISMCNDVLENAHCERVNGTIKNDYLNRWDIRNFEQLKQRVLDAVDNYNNRVHRTLKMTPIGFETCVKELSAEMRPVVEIYTIKQIVENSSQLQLAF